MGNSESNNMMVRILSQIFFPSSKKNNDEGQDKEHGIDQEKETIDYDSVFSIEGGEVFGKLKSPYFTWDESERDADNDFNWEIEGVEDPFYETLSQLYPEKGLWGYREDHIDQFKKISRLRTLIASKRYLIVAKIPVKTKRYAAMPLALATLYFYPRLSEYLDPIIYLVGMYVYAAALLRFPELCRDTYNRIIFRNRYRIGETLGLITRDCDGHWNDYYEFDYGKEPRELYRKKGDTGWR